MGWIYTQFSVPNGTAGGELQLPYRIRVHCVMYFPLNCFALRCFVICVNSLKRIYHEQERQEDATCCVAGAYLQRTFTQQCKQKNAKTGFRLLTAFVTAHYLGPNAHKRLRPLLITNILHAVCTQCSEDKLDSYDLVILSFHLTGSQQQNTDL